MLSGTCIMLFERSVRFGRASIDSLQTPGFAGGVVRFHAE